MCATSTTSTTDSGPTKTTTPIEKSSALDFPALSSSTEAARLRVQHALVVAAVGGLVLAPLDLSARGLRILDCGAADGFYLYELRKQLQEAATAELIGVDVARYPAYTGDDGNGAPSGIQLSQHDILAPFAHGWRDRFDLIQLRTLLSNLSGRAQAVQALRNVLPLLRPGTGYAQLVDGAQVPGRIEAGDKPSAKLLKTLANIAVVMGRDLSVGMGLVGLLQDATAHVSDNEGGVAVEIEIVEEREVHSRFGRGAGSPALEELGVQEVRSLYRIVPDCMQRMGEGIWAKAEIQREEFEELERPLVEEARTEGVQWTWFVAVARRVR